MNTERVLVTTLNVDRQGQFISFQVKIPANVKNIVGIELGLRFKTLEIPDRAYIPFFGIPMTYERNNLVGDLKLMSLEKANLFYTEELKIENNTYVNDFSFNRLFPTVYTHGQKMHEIYVKVDSITTTLKGIYKDKFAEGFSNVDRSKITYTYQVRVYIWVEKEVQEGENK